MRKGFNHDAPFLQLLSHGGCLHFFGVGGRIGRLLASSGMIAHCDDKYYYLARLATIRQRSSLQNKTAKAHYNYR